MTKQDFLKNIQIQIWMLTLVIPMKIINVQWLVFEKEVFKGVISHLLWISNLEKPSMIGVDLGLNSARNLAMKMKSNTKKK